MLYAYNLIMMLCVIVCKVCGLVCFPVRWLAVWCQSLTCGVVTLGWHMRNLGSGCCTKTYNASFSHE